MKRPRLHHVSVPRPPGAAGIAREFYGGLLGFEELPLPKSLQHLDLNWFRLGAETELHVFSEAPGGDTSRRHLCLEFEDVEAVRATLTAAGHAPWDTMPIPGRPRYYCRDPFGNQIEFTTIEGDYAALDRAG
jgi:catechol 2,3-dioxygenase-like lactoylglutathione lyase family enzyme